MAIVDARAEVGYALGRKYWGQGLAPEAVRALFDFGFNAMLLNRIQALCEKENTASSRVMEKTGMSYEGLLRQHVLSKGIYRDLKVYANLRAEWEYENPGLQ